MLSRITALLLRKGLAGTAARMAVSKMIKCGWLQEIDAYLRRGEPLWLETGDGHGTTLVVTDAGLLAIGIEPVAAETVIVIRQHERKVQEAHQPTLRMGTKQVMLQVPTGATMEEIVAPTGLQAHSARGAMSGALGKKLGLVVTSMKEERGRVYRIDQPAP